MGTLSESLLVNPNPPRDQKLIVPTSAIGNSRVCHLIELQPIKALLINSGKVSEDTFCQEIGRSVDISVTP